MNNTQLTKSPYKGLQPYTERDRYFFFGRERDQEIITSNLFASSLTVFYGASGVGKSSVLLAGVVPILRESPRVAVAVFRDWQDTSFETALKSKVLEAIGADSQTGIDLTLEFDEFLLACMRVFRGSLFIILDQFEEYFLYHPLSPRAERFDAAFARAINRSEIGANFLLSMRDDGLSRLDRFQKRIPNLLNNMLRLEPLDKRSAELAIRNPLTRYNETLTNGQLPVQIEKDLVTVLLDDLQAGRVTLDLTGQGRVAKEVRADKTGRIDTPFLQVVLTRLWEDEHQTQLQAGAKNVTLKLDTYTRLGGATSIVRTHLDKTMASERLLPHRETAAGIFHYLVTPTGMKIAHTVKDLTSYAKRPQAEVERALQELSETDVRILRPIAPPPGHQELLRYEIFHDVLAPAILDWRSRVVLEQAEAQAKAEAEQKLLEERKEAEQQAMAQRLEQATALAEAERQRAEAQALRAQLERSRATEQARTAGRLKGLVTGLAVMVVLAGGLAVLAGFNWRLAKAAEAEAVDLRQKAEEESQRATEQAELARKREGEANDAKAATLVALTRAKEEERRAQEQASIAERERNRAEELKGYADTQRAIAELEASQAKLARDNEALYREALALSRRVGTREEAIPKLYQVVGFFRGSNDQPALSAALLSLGQVHAEVDHSANALIAEEAFNEALKLAPSDKDRAVTRARIADIYRELPPWLSSTPRRKALDLYGQAYEEFGKLNDRASQAGMKVAMGVTLGDEAARSSGTEGNTQFIQALEHIQSGLNIYEALGDERNVALALWHAGDVAQKSQSPEIGHARAHDYFTRSLEAYRKLNDKKNMAFVARRLVYIDELMQRHDRALAGYWLVLDLYRDLKQPINVAIAVHELGYAFANAYTNNNPNMTVSQKQALANEAPRLIELMKSSAATPPFTSNATWRGFLLTNLGRIYDERKEYSEAIKVFKEALEEFKRASGYEQSQIYVLGFLTRITRSTGNDQQHKRYLQETAQLIPQLPVLSQQYEHSLQLGSSALDANEDKLAAEAFKVAIDTSKRIEQPIYMPGSVASTLHRVGKEYSLRGRLEEAMGYFTQAIQLYRKDNQFFGEAMVTTSIAEGHAAKKDHLKAIEYHEQALNLYRQASNNLGMGTALRSISASYRILGNNAKAEEYLKQAEALDPAVTPTPPPPLPQ